MKNIVVNQTEDYFREQERELNNPQFQGPMGSMRGLSRDGRMGDRRGGDA
jgi:hypothetical protein